MEKQKVLLGMSGGIDSSLSAYQLIQDGYEVIGISFDFLGDGEIIDKAKKVAKLFKIPHYGIDYSAEFNKKVIKSFIKAYKNNQTPNPCMLCNCEMKFPLLFKWAESLNCDLIATGHYAKIIKIQNEYQLFKSNVINKDQSYFLYHLGQEEIKRLVFPLEGYSSKDEVKEIIVNVLPALNGVKESQGICFIPQNNHRSYLKKKIFGENPPRRGYFLDKKGNLIGSHNGVLGYTIGQKIIKGIFERYNNQKYYILEIDNTKNQIILGQKNQLIYHYIKVDNFNLNFLAPSFENLEVMGDLEIKIDGKGKEAKGRIILSKEGRPITIYSEVGIQSPAPGQTLVIYKDKRLLGGGRIIV